MKLQRNKYQHLLLPFILWILCVLVMFGLNGIVDSFGLDRSSPPVLLLGWSTGGVCISSFFFSLARAFKDKLKKLYKLIICFIAVLWSGGEVYAVFLCIWQYFLKDKI